MEQKAFILQNKGMNRDLSVSKTGESSAYENHNIRILARDNDTLLSVTNERGTKEINLGSSIVGTLLGWNVLNNHIILFTHHDLASGLTINLDSDDQTYFDYIYRVDYNKDAEPEFSITQLYVGHLNFDNDYPIESVVYHETEDIQKIYWVDGRNVLRFMNFMDTAKIATNWNSDDGSFDSNRAASFGVNVLVAKDNTGENRPNGVVQYLLTYYNKHGQETGYVWISDLIYLSPVERGGAADETNSNKILLGISNLDTRFSHFRVYSIFRSSLNGTPVSYLVDEQPVTGITATVIDDGAHLTVQDALRLLYLGSQAVIPGTLEHKDQTLFLGDLRSVGRRDYSELETLLRNTMFSLDNGVFNEGTTYASTQIEFVYSDDTVSGIHDLAYVENVGNYPYENQLKYTSSEIQTFKGNEKYRFALKFKMADGTETDAFWIGDATNTKYPYLDTTTGKIKRVIAQCTIPEDVVSYLVEHGYKTVQLMMAEASFADRSVKAQGIVNPTVFNVWERYNNRTFAMPSWLTRVRGCNYATRHFSPIDNSIYSTGEIQCNYWGDGSATKDPFFQYKDYGTSTQTYAETFTSDDFDYVMIVYYLSFKCSASVWNVFLGVPAIMDYIYHCEALIFTAKILDANTNSSTSGLIEQLKLGDIAESSYTTLSNGDKQYVYTDNGTPRYSITKKQPLIRCDATRVYDHDGARKDVYSQLQSAFYGNGFAEYLVDWDTFDSWGDIVSDGNAYDAFAFFGDGFFNDNLFGVTGYSEYYGTQATVMDACVSGSTTPSSLRWKNRGDIELAGTKGTKIPSYYKKNLMFIDENIVTLDSPEIEYGAVDFDSSQYKFRIVGVAKMTSNLSDYRADVVRGKLPGDNLESFSFSGSASSNTGWIDGITAWPLWKDYMLKEVTASEVEDNPGKQDAASVEVKDRDSSHYHYPSSGGIIRYWLYMWHKAGTINGYTGDVDVEEWTKLNSKTFANLHYSYNTIYLNSAISLDNDDIRISIDVNDVDYLLKIGSENRYYRGNVSLPLTMPGKVKYPIMYSRSEQATTDVKLGGSESAFLYSNSPVLLDYASSTHAVVSLKTLNSSTDEYYQQTILPCFFDSEVINYSGAKTQTISGILLPWDYKNAVDYGESYPYRDYLVNTTNQKVTFVANHSNADTLAETDKYVFIGEIYVDYTSQGTIDTRYGGKHLSDVQNNRFIAAGPLYRLSDAEEESDFVIYGNQGDTYFQRWDDLRIKPNSADGINNVIDIASVMLETHINLDGRCDKQRINTKLARTNIAEFNKLNPVYSQGNNFVVSRDLDEDFNLDSYRSAITWTLQKADSAEVDEWTHVTLADSLKLDSDKGICQALRRYKNSLVAFQDRGIAEILFNSRTQVSTTDGVPLEIANTGKVDGKRYFTNKYGCTNKWSIVEGKAGLYFVDNINKMFCAANINERGTFGIENLSGKLGFNAWFKSINTTEPWKPSTFNNVISFYDTAHSDVYLVKGDDTDQPCLVFSEMLGAFSSFFDYARVPMMTNVEDRFVSAYGNKLWLQNEGLYCNFFGVQKNFWVQYRVAPEPYQDKIWTNIDYHADFSRVLDDSGDNVLTVGSDLTDLDEMDYQDLETFDKIRVWNEYQTTEGGRERLQKKFRTWRFTIPRAASNSSNIHGLDRIRNPWVNILFTKEYNQEPESNKDLMQLHDIIVKYFE